MSAWFYGALIALALGVAVLTTSAFQHRKNLQAFSQRLDGVDRFIDVGVVLHVVRQDPDGQELLPGKPKLSILRSHHFGGIIDTKARPVRKVRETANPRVWYCSEDQEQAILHPDSAPVGRLVHGGMGAGKTTAGIVWTYLRWLEHIGERREGGITAPTQVRVDNVLNEMFGMFAPNWYTYSVATGIVTMCEGTRIRAVSTYRQSASQGSRLQGFNWSWWLGDELQDQIEEYVHIHARLRSGKHGRSKRLGTATAKDAPDWRTLKGSLIASGEWVEQFMLGPRSPFVGADHWESMRKTMPDRTYRRLVLAEDLPPETQLYFGWDRNRNLRPIPITARKITSIALSKKTGNAMHALLAGHDPGSLKGATVYLDAYQVPGSPDPKWWVRGERMHKRQTTVRSARDIIADAKARGCNQKPDGPIVHVRAMPVGQAEDNPSEDLYRIFRSEGLDVKASQYRKDGTGTGVIKKEDRIELVNWLFESERLFIECDDQKRPVAPGLVKALELMERDERGRAEREPKNEHDLSDLPAALGYGLWPFEKSSAGALREEIRKGVG